MLTVKHGQSVIQPYGDQETKIAPVRVGHGSSVHIADMDEYGKPTRAWCGSGDVGIGSRRSSHLTWAGQLGKETEVTCAKCAAKLELSLAKGLLQAEAEVKQVVDFADLTQRLYEALVLLQENLPAQTKLVINSLGADVYGETQVREMDGLKETAKWLVMAQE